jgi:hypothetical protein
MFSLDERLFERHSNALRLFMVVDQRENKHLDYITSSPTSVVGYSWILSGNTEIIADSPYLTNDRPIGTMATMKTHTFT